MTNLTLLNSIEAINTANTKINEQIEIIRELLIIKFLNSNYPEMWDGKNYSKTPEKFWSVLIPFLVKKNRLDIIQVLLGDKEKAQTKELRQISEKLTQNSTDKVSFDSPFNKQYKFFEFTIGFDDDCKINLIDYY